APEALHALVGRRDLATLGVAGGEDAARPERSPFDLARHAEPGRYLASGRGPMNPGLRDCDELARYSVVRDRMDKENELIAGRLNWLIASQSFLVTAFSLASRPDGGSREGRLQELVPWVAIGMSFLIYLTIIAAFLALRFDRRLLLPRLA